VSGNRVDFTFHLFCELHISYMFWSKHMPMVTECSSLFPSVTQWFQPCQLLGNLSIDASGAYPGTCLVMKTRKSEDFMGGQIPCLSLLTEEERLGTKEGVQVCKDNLDAVAAVDLPFEQGDHWTYPAGV
jgi:hypothetical protein